MAGSTSSGCGGVKPALPQRSRRRSMVGEARPTRFDAPPLPGMVASSSMPQLDKRSSTSHVVSVVAPLRIADKKRSSTISITASASCTPTMPQKSRFRSSVDSHTKSPPGPSGAADDSTESSPSSIATSLADGELGRAYTHDAVFTHHVAKHARKRSSLAAVPMGISRSHQEMIDDSPGTFHRTEAAGLFDSVRGLMHDLQLDIGRDDAKSKPEAGQDLRSWLASPQRTEPCSAPAINVTTDTPESSPQAIPPKADGSDGGGSEGTSPRPGGLWGFLRTPSPLPMRTSTASSYSSTSSFIASDPTASSTLSLFSNLLGRSTPETSSPEEAPVRLARTRVDEEKLAHLMISCADTRHVLKTECDPAKLRDTGLRLEKAWRDQLQEAGALRTKLAVAQDTVEDLEDENRQLRKQIAQLAEIIVEREEQLRKAEQQRNEAVERNRQLEQQYQST